jgi:hypothetical protein
VPSHAERVTRLRNAFGESRAEAEAALHQLIGPGGPLGEEGQRLEVARAIAGGMRPDAAERALFAFVDMVCCAYEGLPPREGRGGLSREARAVSAFVKRWRAKGTGARGRPRRFSDAAVEEFLGRVEARVAAKRISRRAAIIAEIEEHFRGTRQPNAKGKALERVHRVEALLRRRRRA